MATSLEHVLTGSVSSHLVTYSTAIIIYHGPVLLSSIRNVTIISISQISNVKLVEIEPSDRLILLTTINN